MSSSDDDQGSPLRKRYRGWKKDDAALIPLRTMQRWETNINVIHNSDGSSNQRGDATTSRANVDGIDYELIGNISDDNDIDSISSNDSSTMSNSLSTDCENLLDDDLSESTLADDRDNDAYSDHSNDSHTDNIDNDDDIEFNYQDRIISPFLYKNGSITLEQSILSILDLYLKHKWTKASLRDTLKMLQEMLPADNRMPETVHKLFRYVQNLAPPFSVIKHFYCRKCLCYNGINDKLAHCTCNASDNTSFFLEIDIREQIKFMFEHRNLADKLILPSSKHDENIIADITDGSEYLRVNSRVGRQECDLTLILNTDGLSVIKSSKSNCWPLVFVIAEVPEHLRESFLTTIGLWYDNKCKPLMNTFLKPFCAKLRQCFYEGIEWTHPQTGKKVVTRIVAPLIVADAPARAAIQNIHNFNGRYGCNICEIKMKRSTKIDGKKRYRIYRYTENFKLRTSSRMRAQARKAMDLKITQVKGVKGPSIIYDLPLIDPGACVLPEYMHSVLLGVVRQITQLWFNKKGPWNLEKYSCDIDKFLSSIRPPYFFNRLPRCITTLLQFYKASEFYNFILFYSLPALVDYLPEKYSQHWILLVKAIFILLQDRIKESNLDEADQLLKLFVSKIEDLYGDRQLTYNVHQLLHLVLVVKRWGPLWATSAFPFENFNGFLANCVHGTKHIGQEMIKNLTIAQGVQVLRNQVMENNTATSLREKKNQLIGSTGSGRKHPVLLYIHGESYDWGSGNPYDGSVLASYTDQVIVTINYRLGVLGFLNANTIRHSKARVANYGLMDQIAALQWVQENIALFGGDPGNVTLMGQGTGAACVNFLAISPTVMPGLFKRAILLSGSALSSWAVVEEPVMYAVKLARAANCTIPEDLLKDHELIVDCLRDASLEELMMTDTQPPTFLSAFGPSVDGVVIKPDFQKDLLSYLGPEFQGSGQLPKRSDHGAPITSNNKYDLLFGVTTSEALWRFAEKDVQQGFEGERRDRIIRTYVRNAYTYHLTEIFYTVVNEYTDWERTVQHPKNTRDACVQALSDAQFVAPLVQTGDLFTLRHMKKPNNPHIAPIPDSEREPMPKTYFYVFDYQMKGGYPEKMGSVHGEELPFVFGAPLVDGFGHFSRNYTRTEVALSENIIQYFANFVRTGNPNSAEHHRKNDSPLPISQEKSKFRSLTWDQYDPVHQKYLEIGVKPRIKNHYRAHQLSVWLRLVPELHRAGMEDVEPKHNLFRGHSDPTIYDGSVRPDPLMRVGDDLTRRSNVTTEAPTTTDYSITTCVSHIQSTNLQNIHNASTDTLASLDAAGYAAYSTALSVTIAIGCSLLILNVLIFAGVYYQRDKTRLEVKSLQQQQMMNQQCGPRGFTELKQPPPSHSHFASSGQVIVDVENEMLRRNVMKGGSNDPGMMQQGQSTHTLPHQHHYQHQKQHGQQHATLPRASVIPEMSMQVGWKFTGPPNGSIHLKVPRAPPPPRAKSPPENQPLLQGATVSSRVSQASMSEMRV